MTTPSSPTNEPPGILVLSAEHIESLVSMDEVIETQRQAFVSLASDQAVLAPRLLVPGRDDSFGFVYASRTSHETDLVIKAGSLVPANTARGLGTISALLLVLDAVTGRPKALLDGAAVTDLRTVAASAAVAQTLCPNPSSVAIIGFGPQGRVHAQVLARILGPTEVRVWAPDATTDGVQSLGIARLTLATSASEAVADADLVVLCTTSREPVVELDWLKPTATVMSLGSVAADRREVGPDLVRSARLVVDHLDTAVVQAGPLVHELEAGTIQRANIESIGDVLMRHETGLHPEPARLTYYNSVGVGIQDATVAGLILDRAAERGIGETWQL